MARRHIPTHAIQAASTTPLSSTAGVGHGPVPFKVVASTTIAQFDIVYANGRDTTVPNLLRVTPADSDAQASVQPPLFVALNGAAAGQTLDVSAGPVQIPMAILVGNVGDLVYVDSTAGGKALAPGTYAQPIGKVTKTGSIADGGSFVFMGAMGSPAGASSFTVIDLNGTFDQDAALTATGDAANIAVTMSHATQTAEALDVSIAQITNARTSGDLVAVKASVTSLTGSTAGVDHVCYDASATAGDADSDHIGLRLGASVDVTLDSRAQTTGKNVWKVGDNLASALDVQEGSNSYIKVVTTNNAEHTEIRSPRPIGPTATAITGATALTIADSDRVFTIAQSSAYDVDLPAPGAADVKYLFQLVSPGAFNVTITVAGAAATFEGTIVNDDTSVVPATGSTLTFASGVAALGDNIEVCSTSSSKYLVRAVSSANGGITIS